MGINGIINFMFKIAMGINIAFIIYITVLSLNQIVQKSVQNKLNYLPEEYTDVLPENKKIISIQLNKKNIKRSENQQATDNKKTHKKIKPKVYTYNDAKQLIQKLKTIINKKELEYKQYLMNHHQFYRNIQKIQLHQSLQYINFRKDISYLKLLFYRFRQTLKKITHNNTFLQNSSIIQIKYKVFDLRTIEDNKNLNLTDRLGKVMNSIKYLNQYFTGSSFWIQFEDVKISSQIKRTNKFQNINLILIDAGINEQQRNKIREILNEYNYQFLCYEPNLVNMNENGPKKLIIQQQKGRKKHNGKQRQNKHKRNRR